MTDGTLLRSTLVALGKPKRLIPICLLVVPIVGLEWYYGNDPLGTIIALIMGVLFPTLAPLSWRALLGAPSRHWVERLALYGGIGMGSVAAIGRLLPQALNMEWTLITDPPSLVAALVIFWVGGWSLGRDIDLEANLDRLIEKNKKIAKEAAHAQMMAVKSYLDPHFIFNTLNAIAEWCTEDPKVAETATLQLSNMLRKVGAALRDPFWPLQKELDLMTDLVELYRIRDPEKFTLESTISEAIHNYPVPPMMLLLLCENAIKHGPWSGHTGIITLSAKKSEQGLWVQIKNPGPFKGLREGGEGIPMLKQRLEVVYSGNATFDIAQTGNQTMATLVLPHATGDAI